MKIIIDSREPENFQFLIKENVNKSIDLEVSTENLDLGDFHIYRNNEDEYPSIIIERKSLNDLISSIKDGRYNEQSFRLNNYLLHNHNIYYLIEGSIEFIKNDQNKQMIYSSIFTLSYFKGFSIINSYNITQSANIIIKFIEKLYKENTKNSFYNNKIDVIEKSKNYSEVIKAQKKSNITKENILEIMLMQIPGVSINVAQIISNNFKSLKNLIENLENNPDCLYNLKYLSESNRKFSKTTINNIKEYLLI
tara:strand:+ start:476 stop:1228 length:753 start_codon:yes stop_codon:yes gene_type:complete